MKDFLNLLCQIIRVDIFIGFGLYSILYVIITIFKKDIKLLETIDRNSARFIVFSGVIYFLSIVTSTIISNNTSGHSYAERGQFWWMPWIQPLIWTVLTQLFWIKKVKDIKILRVIIAILLIVSFERYVIIVTSFHRDYLPSAWNIYWPAPLELVFGLSTKIVLFCFLATMYAYLVDKVKFITGNSINI